MHAASEYLAVGLSEAFSRERSARPQDRLTDQSERGGTCMTSIARRLGVDARRSPSPCPLRPPPLRMAEDKDLIVFDWSGYEEPAFHPGLCRQERRLADLHLLRRRGRGVPEDALRLQDRPGASLLAERGEVARGRAAAAARHVEDRGLERSQSRHHGDEGSRDDRRRHGLVHAVGLGQHAAHLQFREGRREGRRSR